MRRVLILASIALIVCTLGVAQARRGAKPAPKPAPASKATEAAKPEQETGTLRRSNKMEFDERLVKGQTAKSGAVYLFKRVPRQLPGLVGMRRSYRRRIVLPVLGARELKRARLLKKRRYRRRHKSTKAKKRKGDRP